MYTKWNLGRHIVFATALYTNNRRWVFVVLNTENRLTWISASIARLVLTGKGFTDVALALPCRPQRRDYAVTLNSSVRREDATARIQTLCILVRYPGDRVAWSQDKAASVWRRGWIRIRVTRNRVLELRRWRLCGDVTICDSGAEAHSQSLAIAK